MGKGSCLAAWAAAALVTVGAARGDGGKSALKRPAFEPLPLGKVKPAGWLKEQLTIQAEGLSGHLDEFWPDIKDSAWTGGKAEGWERAPYWLDGIVPLAYLLDDEALKGKAKRFIDHVLEHQQADGWMGPVSDGKHEAYDPWPLYVLFKALTQYQEATGDPRVVPAIAKCLRKIDRVITEKPLHSWAHFRSADLILTLYWMYDRTHDAWLLDLARKVEGQGFDWAKMYADLPYKDRVTTKLGLDNHGVNTGMAWKTPAVRYRLTSDRADRDAVFNLIATLDRYHGQATGMFTCDEHLAGRSPSQGTELCTVVEAMYSLEEDVSILGEPALGDRLERIAFNALPATFKKDMCAHQYDQQANQVVVRVSQDKVYASNGPDANIYGLEPNFGCCTANMHQGWPKLASHLWMKSPDGGLAAIAYAPSVVEAEVGGHPVRVELETGYPFHETLKFKVQARGSARFPLLLRIPAWAEGATVAVGDGRAEGAKAGTFHKVDRAWGEDDTVTLRLPMGVRLWKGYHDSVAIERGPLVFALNIPGEWKKIKGREPFADWEVEPKAPWNYALRIDREHPERSLTIETRGVRHRPFSPDGAPAIAKVKGRRVPSWTIEHNAAAPPPQSPVRSDEPLEELTLMPYGCTDLRVTEFPTLKE